jgi:exodeoxyribonuclease VII small subunit
MSDKSGTYEKNFAILEKITESLNKDEIGIDDLVSRTKEALDAARYCMEILKKQRGEFKKLEKEFSRLMENSDEESEHPLNEDDRLVEPD